MAEVRTTSTHTQKAPFGPPRIPPLPLPLPLRAGIALGANIGDRLEYLRRARELIARLPGIVVGPDEPLLCAPVFETEAVGCEPGAGRFLNTVVEIGWRETPRALFDALQGIERQLGRPAEHARNVSRPIDLDLLYAGNFLCAEPGLTLPHPRLHERPFVLAPLAVIRPDLRLPGLGNTVAGLLRTVHAANPVGTVAPFLTGW